MDFSQCLMKHCLADTHEMWVGCGHLTRDADQALNAEQLQTSQRDTLCNQETKSSAPCTAENVRTATVLLRQHRSLHVRYFEMMKTEEVCVHYYEVDCSGKKASK